jgi:hypothetical protein
VIDSCSPNFKQHFSGEKWISFKDNIGHLSITGKDGWGRAFCHGVDLAIKNKFDYVVHIEGDLLFSGDVIDICLSMKKLGLEVLAPRSQMWNWLETGLLFMNVNFMQSINFSKRYNWPTRKKGDGPELIVEKIIGKENIAYSRWIGDRDDMDHVDPEKSIYITHCTTEKRQRFMKRYQQTANV